MKTTRSKVSELSTSVGATGTTYAFSVRKWPRQQDIQEHLSNKNGKFFQEKCKEFSAWQENNSSEHNKYKRSDLGHLGQQDEQERDTGQGQASHQSSKGPSVTKVHREVDLCDSKGKGKSDKRGQQGHSHSEQHRREVGAQNRQAELDGHGKASNEQSKDMQDSEREEKKVEGVIGDNGCPRWGWSCIAGPLVASEHKLQEVFKLNDLRQEAADLYKPPYVFCSEYYKDYPYSASFPA